MNEINNTQSKPKNLLLSTSEPKHSSIEKHYLPEILPIAQPVYDQALESSNTSDDTIVTVSAKSLSCSSHSFHLLFQEQKSLSEDHKKFYEQKIADPIWASMISSLTPTQFSIIISNVSKYFYERYTNLF